MVWLRLAFIYMLIQPVLLQAQTFTVPLPEQTPLHKQPSASASPPSPLYAHSIQEKCQKLQTQYTLLQERDDGTFSSTERFSLMRYFEQEINFYCHPPFGLTHQADRPLKKTATQSVSDN
jgi:hypothetical protein